MASLPDESVVLASERVDGPGSTPWPRPTSPTTSSTRSWREVRLLHEAGIAHRSLRAANLLVPEDGPVVIDLGFAETAASDRLLAIDRAELLASLAALVGVERGRRRRRRGRCPGTPWRRRVPYLQPLALSAATRKQVSKSTLAALRGAVADATGEEPQPLERLVRVRPKTLITIAMVVGAFYVLLPQLASVDDSFAALDDANYGWLALSFVMSILTYVARRSP